MEFNEYERGQRRYRVCVYMSEDELETAKKKALEVGWSLSRWIVHQSLYRHQPSWHIDPLAHRLLEPLTTRVVGFARQFNAEVRRAHANSCLSENFTRAWIFPLESLLQEASTTIERATTREGGAPANYEIDRRAVSSLGRLGDALLGAARNTDQCLRYLPTRDQKDLYKGIAANARTVADIAEMWLERLEQQAIKSRASHDS